MKPFRSLTSILAAAIALSGCTAGGPFPSLAQREVERQPIAEPVRATPVVADDIGLRSAIAEHLARARQADAKFATTIGSAESAARAAGSPGSDSWVAAQEQVSRAEAARAGTTLAYGDLDRLALERSNLPTSPNDQAALASALSEVEQIAAGQQSRLERLKTLIAR